MPLSSTVLLMSTLSFIQYGCTLFASDGYSDKMIIKNKEGSTISAQNILESGDIYQKAVINNIPFTFPIFWQFLPLQMRILTFIFYNFLWLTFDSIS